MVDFIWAWQTIFAKLMNIRVAGVSMWMLLIAAFIAIAIRIMINAVYRH